MYILSLSSQIKKITEKRIIVSADEGVRPQIDNCLFLRNRCYRLNYRGKTYEIVCPEYTNREDKKILITPFFLIHGRKFPIHVYLFAINIYVSNPGMGQRKAAKLTREQYSLETFSHTTLGRVMKALELSIKGTFDCSEAGGDNVDGAVTGANADDNVVTDTVADERTTTRQKSTKRFPSVNDTAARRESLVGFFSDFNEHAKNTDVITASRILVTNWYEKYKRLII